MTYITISRLSNNSPPPLLKSVSNCCSSLSAIPKNCNNGPIWAYFFPSSRIQHHDDLVPKWIQFRLLTCPNGIWAPLFLYPIQATQPPWWWPLLFAVFADIQTSGEAAWRKFCKNEGSGRNIPPRHSWGLTGSLLVHKLYGAYLLTKLQDWVLGSSDGIVGCRKVGVRRE